MLDLAMPWWEFVVRGASVYLVLLLLVRLSGKRTVGQFTPFDLLVVMLLSEAVSNSLTGSDESIAGGLIVAATLVALSAFMGVISSRSRSVEKALEGSPVLLGRDGKVFEQVLVKHRVGQGEMQEALRKADCDQSEMACAFLETDGEISVLKKK